MLIRLQDMNFIGLKYKEMYIITYKYNFFKNHTKLTHTSQNSDTHIVCITTTKCKNVRVIMVTFPFVWGTPRGDNLTPPRTAANAALYPEMASGDVLMLSILSTHLKQTKIKSS